MHLNISFDQELHFVLFEFTKTIFSHSVKKKNWKMLFATDTGSEKIQWPQGHRDSGFFSAVRVHVSTPHW